MSNKTRLQIKREKARREEKGKIRNGEEDIPPNIYKMVPTATQV